MTHPQIENVILVITFLVALAVTAWIPSPYQTNADYAVNAAPAEEMAESLDRTLPELTVTDVDVRRLAYTGLLM
jgi:hypothetical protein